MRVVDPTCVSIIRPPSDLGTQMLVLNVWVNFGQLGYLTASNLNV